MTTALPPLSDPLDADPALEANLRALTTWQGEATALWQSALNQRAAKRPAFGNKLKLTITLLSAAAILLLAAGIFLPSLGKARMSVGRIAFEGDGTSSVQTENGKRSSYMNETHVRVDAGSKAGQAMAFTPSSASFPQVTEKTDWNTSVPSDAPSVAAAPRFVIRKATLELAVPDTRESFAKCQHLLRADLGEFIEASTLTGQGNDARAQLTLRVAASRLDEVLNLLRTFGKVDNENSVGDDVSAQVVDLDAHLRNEKQVEIEVLKLLESRGGKDAQLKDILELREKLSSIRASIEQLQGRRDTLGRQISLASILIILRPDTAEKPAPKPSSLFDGFTNEMSSAWTAGLNGLTQTLAFLIRIAVGGLIWWLLLIAAIAIARRVIRRMIPDPAPIP